MERYRDLPQIADCLFPSDNDAEIPTLDLSMQALSCNIPFLAFGEQKRTVNMGGQGCLHFYVDDYRFNSIYEHPEKILKHHPSQIVEPNGSLFLETPIAFGLQNIYKKRWIARCMQERGIRVFVDLNVNTKFYQLNMLGVPMGWSAFCTRGYSDRVTSLMYEYKIARHWAQNNKLLFVIYGGGAECKRFAKENGCVYINPLVSSKSKVKAFKQIESEGIAFFNEDFSIKKIAAHDIQVEDFTKALEKK